MLLGLDELLDHLLDDIAHFPGFLQNFIAASGELARVREGPVDAR